MTDITEYDAEVVVRRDAPEGAPVDPPVRKPTFAAIVSRDNERAPIIPAQYRGADNLKATAKDAARYAGHVAAFHAVRSPKYAAKAAVWAPVGAGRLVHKGWRWAYDIEQWHLRNEMASKGDSKEYTALVKISDKHKRVRVPTFWGGLATFAGAAGTLYFVAPLWLLILAGVFIAIPLAWAGRPADRPILDRVSRGEAFVRLTAEMVRTALVNVGATKDPGALRFQQEIMRDGPGYLARVNLPAGVEAVDVIEKRGRLSSALRVPVDQVWPSVGPDHAGQLDLWVGLLPASKMGQPTWSLASDTARTSVFEAEEFGTDERQRPVKGILFARNYLIGGVPGSGKSYGGRALLGIAALDPTCELKIAEFKGTADHADYGEMASDYVCGVDEQSLAAGAGILRWGIAEAERRAGRIRKAKERGEAPEGKVTPELAAKRGSGLHPVVIFLDEVHELFGDPDHGKEAAQNAERLIKRGRALGLIVILMTQVPDKSSLPPNITRCVTVRWCMAVQDQVTNDMILGTGAYKRGVTGTVYRPGDDAGWGVATGLPGGDKSVRSHFPKPEDAAKLVARAKQLRGMAVVGDQADRVQMRDILADVRSVMGSDSGLPWGVIAERLAAAWPETYAEVTADMVREALARYDVASQNVRTRTDSGWTNVKGARRDALEAAQAAREITD